ncbi:MAG: hypothetical protein IJ733_15720, partial [Lachnospiraceae bacterium]|nr:hypothetical protein [Lachnospiraceae bacterium]
MAKVDAMSLMAASAKDVTAAAKNQSIRKVEGNTDSFGQYMAKRNDTSEEQTFVKAKEGFQRNEFSNDAKPNYVKKKDYVSELGNGNEAAVAGSVSIEQAGRIVSEIRQIVKSELSTDDAAIDQTLGSMGITALDLLNPDVLKDFLLQLNNVDSTELLTNELLLNGLQSVTELLRDFAEENQVPVFALMELLDTQMPLDEVAEPEVFESFMQQLTGDSEGAYVSPERQ